MKQDNEYIFSEAEQQFFDRQRQQINAAVMAMNNAIGLLIAQQYLVGEWRLKQDGRGIERVDATSAVPEMVTPEVAERDEKRERKANGLA